MLLYLISLGKWSGTVIPQSASRTSSRLLNSLRRRNLQVRTEHCDGTFVYFAYLLGVLRHMIEMLTHCSPNIRMIECLFLSAYDYYVHINFIIHFK